MRRRMRAAAARIAAERAPPELAPQELAPHELAPRARFPRWAEWPRIGGAAKGWAAISGVAAAGALAVLLLGGDGPAPSERRGAAFDPTQAVAEDFGWGARPEDGLVDDALALAELASSGDLTALELLDLEDAAFWRSAEVDEDAAFWDG
ncbi:MAG: hypothetical protein AAF909_15755, partial [Pseudomonadota bacterium]